MAWEDAGSVHDLVTSSWRSSRKLREQATQTNTTPKYNAANQASGAYQSVPTQTSALELSRGTTGDLRSLMLQDSLDNMSERVEAALVENADPEFFLVPEHFNESEDSNLDLVYTMQPAGNDWSEDESTRGDRPSFGSLTCTSLSWNATGLILAAGYGRRDLVGWCDHPGALCTWNLGQDETGVCNPTNSITLDNCLMCVAFHPQQPAIIVGGTYNGEIYLWDLSKDDQQVAVSGASNVSHSEPITQVSWHYNKLEDNFRVPGTEKDKNKFQVITISTDGQILVWSASNLDRPIYGYALLHSRLSSSRLQQWGGTCMDFPADAEDNSTFIVGSEGGTVYRCALQHNQQLVDEFARQAKNPDGWKTARMNLLSPIKTQYEPHVGPVHSIKFSPFHKEIFATCGYDGFMCLYKAMQAKPILRLEPSDKYLLCASWSPFRPLVIAIGAGDGQLFLYDFQKSMLHPAFTIRVNKTKEPVSALAFNNSLPQYLACTAGKYVKVYMLGLNCTKERVLERKQLAHLAESGLQDL